MPLQKLPNLRARMRRKRDNQCLFVHLLLDDWERDGKSCPFAQIAVTANGTAMRLHNFADRLSSTMFQRVELLTSISGPIAESSNEQMFLGTSNQKYRKWDSRSLTSPQNSQLL